MQTAFAAQNWKRERQKILYRLTFHLLDFLITSSTFPKFKIPEDPFALSLNEPWNLGCRKS